MSNVRPIRPAPPESPLPIEDEFELPPSAQALEHEYRRRRHPVPVRRRQGGSFSAWAGRMRRGWKPLLAGALALALGFGVYSLVFQSSWFVLRGSDLITVAGTRQTSPAAVQAVFASDLGRNLFFIPLAARRRALERIPWVRQAAVLRVWPDRLQVTIHERTPVAFARAGSRLEMIDADGVLLRPPSAGQYNFPVLTGLAGVNAAHPGAITLARERRAQVAQWMALKHAVDAGGNHASARFSEVNLRDPGDVRVRVSLPGGGSVLLALGDTNFAARYQLFLSQIAGWRQKYPSLISVDLRFDGQAILDPGHALPPPRSAAAKIKPVPAPQHRHGARR